MTNTQVWYAIAIIVLVTALTRFLPFILLSSSKKTPKIIDKLGKLLPFAIMGMLVVYCLKDVSFASVSGFLPAVIGCIIVAALYIWKRNTLLSIIVGTISYMLLVQLVFQGVGCRMQGVGCRVQGVGCRWQKHIFVLRCKPFVTPSVTPP